jgi:hypothetical protein
VAKQVYVDASLCELQYHYWKHVTSTRKPAHGTEYDGFRHSLGGRLTTKTIKWIETMIRQGFSARQVMQLHQEHVLEAAKQGIQATRDTFIMLDDIHNIAKKRAQELYQKHKNDAISVRMWTEENPEFVFKYQEHELVDVNLPPKEDCTYTLGIQTEWQLRMMATHGHQSAVSFDATFGTNTARVWSANPFLAIPINCPLPTYLS